MFDPLGQCPCEGIQGKKTGTGGSRPGEALGRDGLPFEFRHPFRQHPKGAI